MQIISLQYLLRNSFKIDFDIGDFSRTKYVMRSGKRWEPLSHHTVVHNVTQARPGWSVAPTSIQGRKQESILLTFAVR